MASSPSDRRFRSAQTVANLIAQLARSLSGESYARGLNPAQWSALRFIDAMEPTERTIGAFARFHRTTPSSASQTISALVKKGLIRKAKGEDRRSPQLQLTRSGEKALQRDPMILLAQRVAILPEAKLATAAAILRLLVDREDELMG